MYCRGVRGAITVPVNSRESIISATKELLKEIIQANNIKMADIAAVLFSTTTDLSAEFPAAATRELNWPQHLALLCGHEMSVPNGLSRCLRVLMLINTDKTAEEIKHIYLGEAKKLKEDKSVISGDKT